MPLTSKLFYANNRSTKQKAQILWQDKFYQS